MGRAISSGLSGQAKRLIAIRFLIYTGFQSSYFIGVVGTLTYSEDASVLSTSLAVLLMNVFVILGSFAGGSLLDAVGPRKHFFADVAGVLAAGSLLLAFGHASFMVILGAALVGFMIGFSQVGATSYPVYLTNDAVELKKINSVITTLSNVSVIVGPSLGGLVAAQFSSLAVFPLMMIFALLALIPGWGFRPQGHVEQYAAGDKQTAEKASFGSGARVVFSNTLLTLLFFIMFLTNFGYGAFDPLESFYYRDVLHVGVEWMGWLSSASGIGAVLGALIVLRMPGRLVSLRSLLLALAAMGAGCLVYVGTPYVGVALVGQIALGTAYGAINPLHTTIVQTTTPLETLGRVNSVMNFGCMFAGVAPLALAPWLASIFGVQQTLIGASCIVAIMPTLLLVFGRRMVSRLAAKNPRRAAQLKRAVASAGQGSPNAESGVPQSVLQEGASDTQSASHLEPQSSVQESAPQESDE